MSRRTQTDTELRVSIASSGLFYCATTQASPLPSLSWRDPCCISPSEDNLRRSPLFKILSRLPGHMSSDSEGGHLSGPVFCLPRVKPSMDLSVRAPLPSCWAGPAWLWVTPGDVTFAPALHVCHRGPLAVRMGDTLTLVLHV